MSTLLFLLFWIVIGVGLVLLALRGNRRVESHPASPSRGMPRTWTLGFLAAALVFGILIPGAIVAAFLDQEEASAGGVKLTAEESHGRELFGQRCRSCHTLAAANASSKVGPDLDEMRPPAGLVLNAIEEGRSRGNGQMPADLVEGRDAEAVAAFVAKATGASQ
jgi:mono/diheme cytochrome c family protein